MRIPQRAEADRYPDARVLCPGQNNYHAHNAGALERSRVDSRPIR